MVGVNNDVEKYLEALIEELVIPVSRYEQAEKSYQSLGDWFHREDSKLKHLDPVVYVQGSFRLGTAIRPINDSEEYDVDSVCELKSLTKTDLTQYELKQLLGNEIKAYHQARGMVKPVEEGGRCWTLSYADGAQFHMDVLPALPNGAEQRLILERSHFDVSWADSAISITDRRNPNYYTQSHDWPRSNPKGYAEWFRHRMGALLAQRKQQLVESLKYKGITASVETLPDYRVRTPLQAVVMILKRHRDEMFSDQPDLKPISIIATTLAGHAYGQQNTIGDALFAVLNGMEKYVQHDGSKYVVANPTDPLEIFADKWQAEPVKVEAFFQWLQQARDDFGKLSLAPTYQGMSEAVSARMGGELVARVSEKLGNAGSGLLRSATVAPAAAAPSFANSGQRAPTTPKTFA